MKALQVIKQYGWKEFFNRWKSGINQVTPLQQTQAQITFTKITLVGIALGFAVSIWSAKNLWWLAIIMCGAFGNTYIGLVGLKQKEKLLSQLEDSCKEVKENV